MAGFSFWSLLLRRILLWALRRLTHRIWRLPGTGLRESRSCPRRRLPSWTRLLTPHRHCARYAHGGRGLPRSHQQASGFHYRRVIDKDPLIVVILLVELSDRLRFARAGDAKDRSSSEYGPVEPIAGA